MDSANNVICNAYDCNTMHDDPLFDPASASNTIPVTENWNAMVTDQPSHPMACMWGSCTMQLQDQNTLLSHIQKAHLQGPSIGSHQANVNGFLDTGSAGTFDISQHFLPNYHHENSPSKTVPCLWGDCGASLNAPIPTDHQQCSDCYNPYGDLSKLDTDTLIRHLLSSHFNTEEPSREQSKLTRACQDSY
jgi:hypothetical protein